MKPIGFASLSPEDRRRMAQLGNKTLRERGLSFRWDSDLARAARAKVQDTARPFRREITPEQLARHVAGGKQAGFRAARARLAEMRKQAREGEKAP